MLVKMQVGSIRKLEYKVEGRGQSIIAMKREDLLFYFKHSRLRNGQVKAHNNKWNVVHVGKGVELK